MAQEVVNIPRESTMRQMMLSQKINAEGAADLAYKEKVALATTKEEVGLLMTRFVKEAKEA